MNSAKVLADILAHKKMIERLVASIRALEDEPVQAGGDFAKEQDFEAKREKLITEAEALVKEPPF
jgi:hypothetical protein